MSSEERGWFERAVTEAKALFKRRRPRNGEASAGSNPP